MTSPARRHFLRVTAAQMDAATEAANPLRHATGHELMLAQLADHKRRLKLVQSIERKADLKRELLPDYAAWVEGVLEADNGVQDEVFMTVMVWHIDVCDFAGALPLAQYAIRHTLAMPDQYQRTTACLIAEEYATMALKTAEAGQPVDVDTLVAVLNLTDDQDMPDEVRAKLYKAVAYAQLGLIETTPAAQVQSHRTFALNALKRALELHDKVGVKKDIEKLERELKNAASAGSQEGDGKG